MITAKNLPVTKNLCSSAREMSVSPCRVIGSTSSYAVRGEIGQVAMHGRMGEGGRWQRPGIRREERGSWKRSPVRGASVAWSHAERRGRRRREEVGPTISSSRPPSFSSFPFRITGWSGWALVVVGEKEEEEEEVGAKERSSPSSSPLRLSVLGRPMRRGRG